MASSPLPIGAQPARGLVPRLEEAVLALLLGAMIVLSSLQILLRSVFDSGISWADPMLRVLVLWVGLLGAVAASREGRQITVDVFARLLSGRPRAAVGVLTSLFTVVVAGVLAYHGARFVASEHAFASIAFSGVPAWALESVIPFAFGAIALRYVGHAAADLRTLVRGEDAADAVGPEGAALIAASIVLLVLALLGAPLFAVIATSALLGFGREEIDLSVVAIEIYRVAEMPALVAIPLFTFAGYVLGESQSPERLVRLTQALLGWLRGGLAIVSLATCALFTAFTGASGVTIVALGALLYPALLRANYPERFSLGLVTTSGSLGLLFAPALPLILYGVVAQQMNLAQPVRIDDVFAAGVMPGLLMVTALSAWSVWQRRRSPESQVRFSWRAAGAAVRESIWEIPLPIVVLGGIYSGAFALSEAAAVTALYVLVVEVGIRREIPLSRLPAVMRESMVLVGAILVILSVSLATTNYLIDTEVPTRLFEFIRSRIDSQLTFLILLNLFLLVLGMMLDIFSAIVIVVPIILPVAVGYGIHPVHLGIVFLANMQLGYITPPVGMNLFIASYRFERPVIDVYRATVPFFLILLATVLVITYWPALSLVWLDGSG